MCSDRRRYVRQLVVVYVTTAPCDMDSTSWGAHLVQLRVTSCFPSTISRYANEAEAIGIPIYVVTGLGRGVALIALVWHFI